MGFRGLPPPTPRDGSNRKVHDLTIRGLGWEVKRKEGVARKYRGKRWGGVRRPAAVFVQIGLACCLGGFVNGLVVGGGPA